MWGLFALIVFLVSVVAIVLDEVVRERRMVASEPDWKQSD